MKTIRGIFSLTEHNRRQVVTNGQNFLSSRKKKARKIRGRINDKEKLVTTYESLLNVCMEVAYSVFNNHDKIGKEIESSYL